MKKPAKPEYGKYKPNSELSEELTHHFKPKQFETHVRAFRAFKLSEEQMANELAEYCNLIFVKFITRHTKLCDFIPPPLGSNSRGWQIWQCRGLRCTGPRLAESFRGRVMYVSDKLVKKVLEPGVGVIKKKINLPSSPDV